MSRLMRVSILAIVVGIAPLALALLGFGMDAMLACVNPPFAQPMTGACGVAERLSGLIWSAVWTLPIAVLGTLGVLAWVFSNFRPR